MGPFHTTLHETPRELLPQTAYFVIGEWVLVAIAWAGQFLPRVLPDSISPIGRATVAVTLVFLSGAAAFTGGLALVVSRTLQSVRYRTAESVVAVLLSASALLVSLVLVALPMFYATGILVSWISGLAG